MLGFDLGAQFTPAAGNQSRIGDPSRRAGACSGPSSVLALDLRYTSPLCGSLDLKA